MNQPEFLPTSQKELANLGWIDYDILLVTGDAYIDHPAFGVPLIGRYLVSQGYKVAIMAQPDWKTPASFTRLGSPRLFIGVSAGALDSMVAHYTSFRKKRHTDAYTPGGEIGHRPNRASLVYVNCLKQVFPGIPIVLGGVESSLRKASHYDFWSDSLKRSLLLDSKADLILSGMAETSILKLAQLLDEGSESDIDLRHRLKEVQYHLAGTTFRGDVSHLPESTKFEVLPSHEEIINNRELLMMATQIFEAHSPESGEFLIQKSGSQTTIFSPPASPCSAKVLDRIYSLPFTRRAHPSYRQKIPALDMIQFSMTTHRGCGGGCTFCSLTVHQGKKIASRTKESLLNEARRLTRHPDFRGSITDVGGPSANMWSARCTKEGACKKSSCLFPRVCPYYVDGQDQNRTLLDEISKLKGINNVRIASGIRHDLALANKKYAKDLITRYTGGQLKLAPEHIQSEVLRLMKKPSFSRFEEFMKFFQDSSVNAGKTQFIIPYLISAFPGCRDRDMKKLATWLQSKGWKPKQIQCFLPSPGTVATAMYYSGMDCDGNRIYVALSDADRRQQHKILSSLIDGGETKEGKKTSKPKPAFKKSRDHKARKMQKRLTKRSRTKKKPR